MEMAVAGQLREAVRDLHDQIELTVLAKQMFNGTVPRQPYLELAMQLHHIHAAVEATWADSPELVSLYPLSAHARASVLIDDCRELGMTTLALPWPPTQHLLDHTQAWSSDQPTALVGLLYVLEGSRMGSRVLINPLAKALGSPAAIGYHSRITDSWKADWNAFKSKLEAHRSNETAVSRMIQAARQTFACLLELYSYQQP